MDRATIALLVSIGARRRLRRTREGIPPSGPSGCGTVNYDRIASQIEAGKDHLDHVFTVGAQRILARINRSDQHIRIRR